MAQNAQRAGMQSSAAIGRAVRGTGGLTSRLYVFTPNGWKQITDDAEDAVRPFDWEGGR